MFARGGDFDKDGIEDLALVGVYADTDVLEVWWCMECDHSQEIVWDPATQTFRWAEPLPEDDDA